jgi:hypothetical protein
MLVDASNDIPLVISRGAGIGGRDTPGRKEVSADFSWHALLERSSAEPTATVPRMSTH